MGNSILNIAAVIIWTLIQLSSKMKTFRYWISVSYLTNWLAIQECRYLWWFGRRANKKRHAIGLSYLSSKKTKQKTTRLDSGTSYGRDKPANKWRENAVAGWAGETHRTRGTVVYLHWLTAATHTLTHCLIDKRDTHTHRHIFLLLTGCR